MRVTDPKKVQAIEQIYQEFLEKLQLLDLEREEIERELKSKLNQMEIEKILKEIKNN